MSICTAGSGSGTFPLCRTLDSKRWPYSETISGKVVGQQNLHSTLGEKLVLADYSVAQVRTLDSSFN